MLTITALLRSVERRGGDGRKALRLNDATPVLEVKVLPTPRPSADKIIMIKSKPLSQATKQKRERKREEGERRKTKSKVRESGARVGRKMKGRRRRGCEGGNRASGEGGEHLLVFSRGRLFF